MKKWVVVLVIAVAVVGLETGLRRKKASADQYRGWTTYGGGPDNIHYSSLKQINRENVRRLSVAWSYDTGDTLDGSDMQCNPVIVRRGPLCDFAKAACVCARRGDRKRALELRSE